MSIGVPGDIQPVASPTFTVRWRVQQPLDNRLEGLWRRIVDEITYFLPGRRQSRKIKCCAANQLQFRRWFGEFEALLMQPGYNKAVDLAELLVRLERLGIDNRLK